MTKTEFIETITVLQKQHDLDVKHHKALCEIYGAEDVAMYDNTFLVNHLIKQLQKAFPVGDDGECEIERFIYTYDFGRITMAGIKDAGELWNVLNEKKLKRDLQTDVLNNNEDPKDIAFNLFNELTSRFSHHNILSEAFFDIAIHEVESILLYHPIPVNPESNQIEFNATWKNVKKELINLKESYKNANTN